MSKVTFSWEEAVQSENIFRNPGGQGRIYRDKALEEYTHRFLVLNCNCIEEFYDYRTHYMTSDPKVPLYDVLPKAVLDLMPTAKVLQWTPFIRDQNGYRFERRFIDEKITGFDAVLVGWSTDYGRHNWDVAKAMVDNAFRSGVPIFASGFGMQVVAEVAGGEITQNTRGNRGLGIEFPLAENIQLTPAGEKCPWYAGKPTQFSALSSVTQLHVSQLPKQAEVLASNAHCEVQAMHVKHRDSEAFCVQYHPDFRRRDSAKLMSMTTEYLVRRKRFFASMESMRDFWHSLESQPADAYIPATVADEDVHRLELANWLKAIA